MNDKTKIDKTLPVLPSNIKLLIHNNKDIYYMFIKNIHFVAISMS
jgi:hypothetical protein